MHTDCNAVQLEFEGFDGRKVVAGFDGGAITSDAGGLLLRHVDAAIGLFRRLAACFTDHRHRDYKGYDSNWFRKALADRGIEPCIPPTKSRKQPIDHDKGLYRQRRKLKDWRRIATRYDRCAHTFFSAICIAATVIFWL